MKNINSVLGDNSQSLINTESVNFDYNCVVKFSHKWLQIKEPENNEMSEEIILAEIDEPETNNQTEDDSLLQLLCLLFEEKAEVPLEYCQIYKEGLEILLGKWDENRRVKGDHFYKNLSLQRKQDLLSKIAFKTFEQGELFFKTDVEQYITNYICNLPNASSHPEVLEMSSQAILKSITRQHKLFIEQAKGIYSFSDIKFHQYFAAREIVESYDPQSSEQALKNLVSHLNENRWHEVFLLVVGMLRNGDYLLSLMQQQTDAIVAGDQDLQYFLSWLHQKSNSETTYKPATFRAFYLEFILGLDSSSAQFEGNCTDYQNLNPVHVDATFELLNFPFTEQQKAVLKQYYEANQLLLDCLDHARYVTLSVRKQIEGELLAPSTGSNQAKSAIA